MENIYINDTKACTLVSTNDETIAFLMSYSKSLRITNVKGLEFENNLN